MTTLYARQEKSHRCIEQTFELFERGWGCDGLWEWHWNMYIIICEMNVQVWCMIQNAWGWCTGMTKRDGMGREVGGGFSMGNTCTPMVDSCQCMAKPIQYCKVISLQLKLNTFILKTKQKIKYKRDWESFWHRYQRRQKEYSTAAKGQTHNNW